MQRFANLLDRVLGRGRNQEVLSTTFNLNQIRQLPCTDDDPKPHARSGHRIFTDDDYIYVIGGYDVEPSDGGFIFKELWRYNLLTKCWSQVSLLPGQRFPQALASHAIAPVIPLSPYIICYGGSQIPFGETNSNSVFLVSALRNGISSIELNQKSPRLTGIYGHAMCSSQIEDNVFYVVGGTTGHDYFCDVHKLTLAADHSCEWEQLNMGSSRPGRYRLEVAHDEINNRLLLLGGGSPDFAEGFDQITVFNLSTNLFETVTTKPDGDEFPTRRRSHSLVKHGRFLVMAGGCAPAIEHQPFPLVIRGDIWRLDLDTLQWTQLGSLLPPVFFHDATVTSDGMMLIWGGVTSADSSTRTAEGQYMWLAPPTLKTLAAHQLAKHYPGIFCRNVEGPRITNMKEIWNHLSNHVFDVDPSEAAC
ncbi:unnamed protein product, partial [Mesorhabditis belari]|uniref:Kelch domain-containing protein 10 n=1 Tax=Mesorhabditis belari TaxID=2138241 RepID=A0AAF3J973_9BILA